jgi:hypothetical protein
MEKVGAARVLFLLVWSPGTHNKKDWGCRARWQGAGEGMCLRGVAPRGEGAKRPWLLKTERWAGRGPIVVVWDWVVKIFEYSQTMMSRVVVLGRHKHKQHHAKIVCRAFDCVFVEAAGESRKS